MTKADEANRILAECPNGWTSIRTLDHFCRDIGWLYIPESDDELSSDDKSLSVAELKEANDLAVKIIDTAYERTKARLNGGNDNFLISCLYFAIGNKNFGFEFKRFLKELIGNYTYADEDIFLRDALWAVQRQAMRENSDDFHYGLTYLCINLSKSQDEKFILEEIVPEMKRCGKGSMIPDPYDER
jgi:hypothetical protein